MTFLLRAGIQRAANLATADSRQRDACPRRGDQFSERLAAALRYVLLTEACLYANADVRVNRPNGLFFRVFYVAYEKRSGSCWIRRTINWGPEHAMVYGRELAASV